MFRLSSDTALIELNTWRKVIQLQPVLKFLTIAWVYLIQVNLLRLRLEAFVSTNICVRGSQQILTLISVGQA